MPDWQIIARIACEMGYAEGFTFASAAEVFDELKHFGQPKATGYDDRAAPAMPGCATQPLQWPIADAVRRPTATRSAIAILDPGAPARSRPGAAGPASSPARICCRPRCRMTSTRSCSTPGGCSTSGIR